MLHNHVKKMHSWDSMLYFEEVMKILLIVCKMVNSLGEVGMKSPRAVPVKSAKQSIYFYLLLSSFVILFLLLPTSLWAATAQSPGGAASGAGSTTTSSSSSGQAVSTVSGTTSQTLVNVPYQFTVTVSEPWHYINGTSYSYGTYYAICPGVAQTISGPSATDIAAIAACTCDKTKCTSAYLTQTSVGTAQTMAVCLAFIPTYVPTSSIPKGTKVNGQNVIGNMPIVTTDAKGNAYVYPLNDNPGGVGIINNSSYNPIPNFSPLTSAMDFNNSYIKATGRSKVSTSLPCPN